MGFVVSKGPFAGPLGFAGRPSSAESVTQSASGSQRRSGHHLPGVPKRLVVGFTLWALAGLAGLDLVAPSILPGKSSTDHAPPTLADLLPIEPPVRQARNVSNPQTTKTLIARAGDTLSTLLHRAGLEKDETEEAVAALSQHFDPRRLKVGQDVHLTLVALTTEGAGQTARQRLMNLSVKSDVDRKVEARRTDDGSYEVQELIAPLRPQAVVHSGIIHGSLFESANAAGLPAKVVFEMIRIFSYDVDFQRDIQDGDSYEVMFDRQFDETGRAVKDGDITYASMTLSGRKLELYRYTPSDTGDTDYYDAKGSSMQRALKRTPIDGARLTSTFGMRNHPILGYTRMHRGVDFAAPAGTPIQAAGAGKIEEAGRHAGYGLYIRLSHDDRIETAYGHMSRLAPGLKVGHRVRQGQIIGYVGSTGLATGPHLHYEVIVNNLQVNPAKVALPAGRRLDGTVLAEFHNLMGQVQTAKRDLPQAPHLATATFSGK